MKKISVFIGSLLILTINFLNFYNDKSLEVSANKVDIKQASSEAGANCGGGGSDCLARHKDS